MIILNAKGKFIDTKQIERLFTQGEHFSDKIGLLIDNINNDVNVSDCTFIIRTCASDGCMTETLLSKELQDESVLLIWEISKAVTAVPGKLWLELVGAQDENIIIKYKMPPICIKEAVMGMNIPVPDVVEAKLALMNQLLAEAEEIARKILDEDGTAKEVINARAGAFSDYVYASLSQRLNAELGACVRQNLFEQRIAALMQADMKTDNSVKAVSDEIIAARTGSLSEIEHETLDKRLSADFTAVNGYLSNAQTQIDIINSTVGSSYKKNLLPYPASITKGGIVFTCDENGYMSCSTPTDDKRGLSAGNAQYSLFLRAGTYVLSFVSETVCTSEYGYIWVLKADSTIVAVKPLLNNESGSVEFTLESDQTVYVFSKMFDGKIAAMIRYASISDSTYEPYTQDIQAQINALRNAVIALGGNVSTLEYEVPDNVTNITDETVSPDSSSSANENTASSVTENTSSSLTENISESTTEVKPEVSTE